MLGKLRGRKFGIPHQEIVPLQAFKQFLIGHASHPPIRGGAMWLGRAFWPLLLLLIFAMAVYLALALA